MNPSLGLRLIGTISADVGPPEPTLFEVTGLTPEDVCVVGYAGRDYHDTPQWALTWYWSAKRIDTPERTFDSPEDALAAAEEFWAKMKP